MSAAYDDHVTHKDIIYTVYLPLLGHERGVNREVNFRYI